MDDLREMKEFANSDPEAIGALQIELQQLETRILAEGFSSSVIVAIASMSRLLSSLGQTDMCHLGEGAPAPRWDGVLGGMEYSTCGHCPPHIQLKRS